MTRILYVECRNGRPVLDDMGVGYCYEVTDALDPEFEYCPYVPASELESLDGLIECLKADRDSFVAERNRFKDERDQALARVRELEWELEQVDSFVNGHEDQQP